MPTIVNNNTGEVRNVTNDEWRGIQNSEFAVWSIDPSGTLSQAINNRIEGDRLNQIRTEEAIAQHERLYGRREDNTGIGSTIGAFAEGAAMSSPLTAASGIMGGIASLAGAKELADASSPQAIISAIQALPEIMYRLGSARNTEEALMIIDRTQRDYQNHMRQRAYHNPVASNSGQIAGGIASAFIAPGSAYVNRITQGQENLANIMNATNWGGGVGSNFIRNNALRLGGISAVEGVGEGANNALINSWVNNTELTGEEVAFNMLLGGALGGLGGAVQGGLAAARLSSAINRTGRLAGNASRITDDVTQEALGETIGRGSVEGISDASNDTIRRAFSPLIEDEIDDAVANAIRSASRSSDISESLLSRANRIYQDVFNENDIANSIGHVVSDSTVNRTVLNTVSIPSNYRIPSSARQTLSGLADNLPQDLRASAIEALANDDLERAYRILSDNSDSSTSRILNNSDIFGTTASYRARSQEAISDINDRLELIRQNYTAPDFSFNTPQLAIDLKSGNVSTLRKSILEILNIAKKADIKDPALEAIEAQLNNINQISQLRRISEHFRPTPSVLGTAANTIGGLKSGLDDIATIASYVSTGIPIPGIVQKGLSTAETGLRTLDKLLRDAKNSGSLAIAFQKLIEESISRRKSGIAKNLINSASKNVNVTRQAAQQVSEQLINQTREQRTKTINGLLDRLENLNPKTIEDLTRNMYDTDQTSQVGILASATTSRAISYLQQEIPKHNFNPALPNVRQANRIPDSEMDSFLAKYNAVRNPFSVINSDWNSVRTESFDAIRNVYPTIYEQTRNDTIEMLGQMTEPPSYDLLNNLNRLLEINSDESFAPGFNQRIVEMNRAGELGAASNGGEQMSQDQMQNQVANINTTSEASTQLLAGNI